MTYDRQIIISIGNSLLATRWPAITLWWSELVERLRTPVRGTETLQQYLSYNNLYTHPAIGEYNKTATAANQTVQTLIRSGKQHFFKYPYRIRYRLC